MYRRRRITVGALGLFVLAVIVIGVVLLVQTLGQSSDEPAPVAQVTATAEPTAPMPSGDAASGMCPPEAIAVGAATDEESYDPGATATLELVVKNNHDSACMIAVGTGQQTFSVRQDGNTVWSSEYCADPAADGDAADTQVVFAGGMEKRSALTWTIEPVDESCNRHGGEFAGGTYQLVTELGGTQSPPVDFEITAPEPTASPSEEPAEAPVESEEPAEAPSDG